MTAPEAPTVSLSVDGVAVELPAEGTLLDALRDELGLRSPKDGCSPQGQCGCCTVLVDGMARVACVTPLRRVAGRQITTLDGLDAALRDRLVTAFEATGASQCGFCTPGILVRLAGLARKGRPSETQIRTALGAHLCRCTGLQPIVEAACRALDPDAELGAPRQPSAAEARATLESGVPQRAGPQITTGCAPFASDTELDCVVALGTADGGYVLAESLSEARRRARPVQGRNSTVSLRHPVSAPEVPGAVVVLETTFVEPAHVEPDASWCDPGGEPSTPFANAGAFGAKRTSAVRPDARRLADEQGRRVLALWPREEVVRRGKKRPPVGLALRGDGTGAVRIGVTPLSDELDGLLESLSGVLEGIELSVLEIAGPPIGASHRGAVLAEVLAARALLAADEAGRTEVTTPNGARAAVVVNPDGSITVEVLAGEPLCEVTLRSYVTGAVHQALGMVRSEGLAVDEAGVVHDLTIRSFGILSATETPRIEVTVLDDAREALAVGTAVLAATMGAAWLAEGRPSRWPTRGVHR